MIDLTRLKKVFEGDSPYRFTQAYEALFRDLVNDWQEAIALPIIVREELNQKCPIKVTAKTFASADGNAIRALITLNDGLRIETVLMRHGDRRNTVCVSSQVGCPMGCSFCATGKLGFTRNLEAGEIIDQVLFFARYLKKIGQGITNIVFMGMGEPFLNYDQVIGAIRILNDKKGFGLGARHFSISTVGVLGGIGRLAGEKLQVNLAISLHAPDDELRSRLIPANNEYPIAGILKEVDDYIAKTRRRVMFEYVMIKNVNDSEKHAEALVGIMKKPLYFVNLISYNPTGIFDPSPSTRIKKFKEILEKNGIAVTQRYRFGEDIEGACGQLAAKGM